MVQSSSLSAVSARIAFDPVPGAPIPPLREVTAGHWAAVA